MQENDIVSTLKAPVRLISDEYYFKYIFKKTEKIICAVFYILSDLRNRGTNSALIDDLENEALHTLSFAGETLSLRKDAAQDAARPLAERLVVLESKLRVLASARMLPNAHLDVFVAEIDAALRSIRGMEPAEERKMRSTAYAMPPHGAQREVRPASTHAVRGTSAASKTDRRSRIAAVLRANPGASIKDISDTITDCSEKTIQRELTTMIKDGIVRREGEKRWSTYQMVG